MGNEEIRRLVYEQVASMVQALGSPARLKIIQLLAQSPRTVEGLSQLIGESVANTSQHLQKLKKEDVVQVSRDGLHRIYQIKNAKVLSLWEAIQDLAQSLSPDLIASENQLSSPELLAKTDLDSILVSVKKKKAILLDVRPAVEAVATPIEGAISMPLEQLAVRRQELSKHIPIFVFCRGRFCSMATQAVTGLRKAGFRAERLRQSPFQIRHIQEVKL